MLVCDWLKVHYKMKCLSGPDYYAKNLDIRPKTAEMSKESAPDAQGHTKLKAVQPKKRKQNARTAEDRTVQLIKAAKNTKQQQRR